MPLKNKQIISYRIPKETVADLRTLEKNTKASVSIPNGNTDFFDKVTRVVLGDITYYYYICLYTAYCTDFES